MSCKEAYGLAHLLKILKFQTLVLVFHRNRLPVLGIRLDFFTHSYCCKLCGTFSRGSMAIKNTWAFIDYIVRTGCFESSISYALRIQAVPSKTGSSWFKIRWEAASMFRVWDNLRGYIWPAPMVALDTMATLCFGQSPKHQHTGEA